MFEYMLFKLIICQVVCLKIILLGFRNNFIFVN